MNPLAGLIADDINPLLTDDPAEKDARVIALFEKLSNIKDDPFIKSPNKKKFQKIWIRRPEKTKMEEIIEKLEAIGHKRTFGYGDCARRAIYKGFIKMKWDSSDLEQTVHSGVLQNCGHSKDVTLLELLQQRDYAGYDFIFHPFHEETTVKCDVDNNCKGSVYVTGMCSGNPRFDSGESHSHCNLCPNFGQCLGHYHEGHCTMCGNHYYRGLEVEYLCPCQDSDNVSSSRSDDE